MIINMAHGDTGNYEELHSDDEAPRLLIGDSGELLGGDLPIVVVPEQARGRWNHIEDLDSFFRKIYEYHQNHGFLCMVIETFAHLLQCVFVIIFVTFLFSCVDYAILFREKPVSGHNSTEHIKVKLKDGIIPPGQCLAGLSGSAQGLLVIVLLIWAIRVVKMMFRLRQFLDVKGFYTTALKVLPSEFDDKTWYDIQQGLIDVQREHNMSVNKKELTELDIYHRILRHENYLVAMVADGIIPVEFSLPILGTVAFLSKGYRYNLEAIFFWSPWAPFRTSCNLKDDYDKNNQRLGAAKDQLQTGILVAAGVNTFLTPIISIWQLLSIIFSYADIARREPGLLGARMWSEYARVKLRHYNELEHELNSRLCKAYKPALAYVNCFTSHVTTVIARNVIFFAGSFLFVLVALTLWDEDFLSVEHIMTSMAVLSVTMAICRAVIPNEHIIPNPDLHKQAMLQHIHYKPDEVRDELSKLFTYKFSHLLSEVLSPFVMPFILLKLHGNAESIVNFLYEKTDNLEGVGDVCTYANLDLGKHGTLKWVDKDIHGAESLVNHPVTAQSDIGKVEFSLVHFKSRNPSWMPESQIGKDFLKNISAKADDTFSRMNSIQDRDPNFTSYVSIHPHIKLSTYSICSTTDELEESSARESLFNSIIPSVQRNSLDSSEARMSASALLLHENSKSSIRSHSVDMAAATSSSLFQTSRILPSIRENEKTPLLRRH